MVVKKFLIAVWIDVITEEGYPTVQVLKQPETLRCGDTILFKVVVGRTDLIPKKAFVLKMKAS